MNAERLQWIEIGDRLKHMREWDNRYKRKLAAEEVIAMLHGMVPDSMVFSRSKLRNMEQGSHKPNFWDVELLCAFYGRQLEDVAPEMVAERDAWQSVIERVRRRSDPEDGPDGVDAGNPCFTVAA